MKYPSPIKAFAFGLNVAAALLYTGCGTSNPHDAYFRGTRSQANIYVAPTDARYEKKAGIMKIAIMPFKAATELIGSSVSDMFVTEMLKAGRYDLVERGQISQVLGEAELAISGLSVAKAQEVGSMLGAEAVLIGTVDEYSTVAYRGRTYPVVGITTRLIECQTGKVIWSVDLAKRAEKDTDTLSQHARVVVHEIMAGLYQNWN